jgi:hypothetical protein
MPRDTDKKMYLSIAVNKDSDLMRQLIEDERRKGIPKSHLIVSYADEYVRLFIQGGTVPVAPSITHGTTLAPNLSTDNIITSGISDEDLEDAYGD